MGHSNHVNINNFNIEVGLVLETWMFEAVDYSLDLRLEWLLEEKHKAVAAVVGDDGNC